MEEFEYEDDWDEEEEEDEEEGWGLSKEEIAKRLQQVNQEQDKREEKKEEQKEKKRGRKKGTKNKTRKEKKKRDPNAPPKSKRSKRQGLKLLLIRDYLYNEASEKCLLFNGWARTVISTLFIARKQPPLKSSPVLAQKRRHQHYA